MPPIAWLQRPMTSCSPCAPVISPRVPTGRRTLFFRFDCVQLFMKIVVHPWKIQSRSFLERSVMISKWVQLLSSWIHIMTEYSLWDIKGRLKSAKTPSKQSFDQGVGYGHYTVIKGVHMLEGYKQLWWVIWHLIAPSRVGTYLRNSNSPLAGRYVTVFTALFMGNYV